MNKQGKELRKMIKITNVQTFGWQTAIRGMRNPLNSWSKSDSGYKWTRVDNKSINSYVIGQNDLKLM